MRGAAMGRRARARAPLGRRVEQRHDADGKRAAGHVAGRAPAHGQAVLRKDLVAAAQDLRGRALGRRAGLRLRQAVRQLARAPPLLAVRLRRGRALRSALRVSFARDRQRPPGKAGGGYRMQ
jgi:hypothetical protein